ncbi:MAG: YraN family protein, partial [Sphingobacteriales bacterium]
DHIETGKIGEELAAGYILQLGFQIMERNWRYRRCEIDIVASAGNILHFIEVKTRSSVVYGYPEESVSDKKIGMILKGAAVYCYQHPGWSTVQYDVLSVLIEAGKDPEYFFIQDIGL